MLRGPHLRLIAAHSVRHGLRGGAGLISLLLTLVLGLIATSIVVGPLDATEQALNAPRGQKLSDEDRAAIRARADGEVIDIGRKVLKFVTDVDDPQADYLTHDKPAVVSGALVLFMLLVPLSACLAGFNQTSGDIGSKGLRFLLIRTERDNLFLGRFIGTAVFTALVLLLLVVIVGIYMAVKVHVHATGDMMLWLASGYVRLALFSLPYVALCAWISSSMGSPLGSLFLSLLPVYGYPLLILIGGQINASAKYGSYLTPWGYKWWLFSPDIGTLLAGVAVMLAFTGLLLFVGIKSFSKRDL